MALLHSLSKPAIRGEAELFSIAPTDTTTDYSMYEEFQPVVNVQDATSKIEFKIPGNGHHYLDLNDSFLYLRLKVVQKNGKDLEDASKMGTSNLFMHSLFSQMDIHLNEKLVSTSNNAYPYRAYLENLLSYGNDYKSSQGTCALYYDDTNGGGAVAGNLGWASRKEFIHKSVPFEMIDKLRFNLGTQHRYILNDVNVRISLTRSSDAFSLYTESTTEEACVKLLSATYYVRKQVLFPSIILAHQRLLEKGEVARYPHKNTEVKYFTIAQGSSSTIEDNLFSNNVPSRVVLGFVSSSSFNGRFTENPFRFKNYNISSLGLSVNNISMPIRPLTFNFPNNEYLLAYYLLFTSTGIAGQDVGLSFSRSNYKENNAVFAFDILQCSGNESLLALEKTGSVKIEVQFAKALSEAVHCVVLSEHQAVLEVDKYRQANFST